MLITAGQKEFLGTSQPRRRTSAPHMPVCYKTCPPLATADAARLFSNTLEEDRLQKCMPLDVSLVMHKLPPTKLV